MSETPIQPGKDNVEPLAQDEHLLQPKRRGTARGLGCGLALLLWFTLLLTPCALFYLAANGEMRLEHTNIPQPHAHPLLLISLISETDDRGLRIETSWIANGQTYEPAVCVETAVRFLLWEYSGGNQNVRYCDCYERPESDSNWRLASNYGAACSSAE